MASPLNRLAFLTASLTLLVVAFPLISIGSTSGPSWLWWIGLLALVCGGLLPPAYRLLSGRSTEAPAAVASSDDHSPPPPSQGVSR